MERELRSAKTYFKHKVKIEKFKKETFEKLDRNIHHNYQPTMEQRRKKRYPKWMLASVASVMIIAAGFTFGGSYIADAAQSLISQLFGSKENLMETFPDEPKEEFSYFERHLQIAKENLTEEEFNTYSQLYQEQFELLSELKEENREPNGEEAAKLHDIKESMSSIQNKFALVEAQQLVSFKITQPTYVPEGYKQTNIGFYLKEEDIGKEPIVTLDYSDGESGFGIQQLNINRKSDLENAGFFENSETYYLNGFQVDFISDIDTTGMRVTVPEKDFKIILFAADDLPKEEMEKVLLSMVEK